jgi:glyoxylase-like metal-dependent hydrolase (beta-lactamase superfamily II)
VALLVGFSRRLTVRRVTALVTLVAVGALSAVLAASQAPAQAPRVVEVEKLRENLFILKGGGGNTAAFITATGVVLVDTKIPGWGQPLLEKVKSLTNKPITTVINTHTHFDHVGGNPDVPATVDIVAHENTRANMEAMRPVTGIPLEQQTFLGVFKDSKGRGIAKRTFKDKMSIGSGADQIDLYYFGRGHTNGDAWVVFPSLRVMHGGDIFSGKNLPLLDANNGGSGLAIGDTLAKAAAGVGNVESIITGHSTVMTLADLRQYAEFNREFAAAVQAGKKAGRTADEIAAGWSMPAKYTGYAAPQPARLKANVEVILNELK